MLRWLLAVAVVLCVSAQSLAQPFNVRAWFAQGQVFVVWQFPAPPAVPTNTVEIFASPAAQVNTAFMTRVGQLFFPEYTGSRLTALNPAARLLIPTPAGGTYRLAVDEGVFVYTPHAAGNLFFAVVDSGSAVVNAGNSTAAAFAFNPAADPVRPHPQFTGFTTTGFPYVAFVVWADGRDDDVARPDIPVLGNSARNGVPHVFTVTAPLAGIPPAPYACALALHGGGGEYQLFRPGEPARSNLSLPLTNGVVVTPDDTMYCNVTGLLENRTTGWFGYDFQFDPFTAAARVAPANSTVVRNYTQRRVFWILDWLNGPLSPYDIDPERTVVIGHSNGGRGASHLSRLHPERFAAAVLYTPPFNFTVPEGAIPDFLRGTFAQNLDTNLLRPDGLGPVGVFDAFNPTFRLSPTQRDLPVTRAYFGKRDTESTATWNAGMRAVLDEMNDSRLGAMIFWDEREHGVELWSTENAALPGPDIGQWVAPVRSIRPSLQYLVDTYRATASYPGFFNSDHDPVLAMRQPDPGDGDPNLGDPFGAWSGYFDWEAATAVETPTSWQSTLFATGLSAVAIDNAPVVSIITDVIPRKTTVFIPSPGRCIRWTATDTATNLVVQSGATVAEADGVVTVTGLAVPRDPARIRLRIDVVCPVDINCSGVVDADDIFAFLNIWFAGPPGGACSGCTADWDGDGAITADDIFAYLNGWFAFGPGNPCP